MVGKEDVDEELEKIDLKIPLCKNQILLLLFIVI